MQADSWDIPHFIFFWTLLLKMHSNNSDSFFTPGRQTDLKKRVDKRVGDLERV